jgi:hypothetical protein
MSTIALDVKHQSINQSTIVMYLVTSLVSVGVSDFSLWRS